MRSLSTAVFCRFTAAIAETSARAAGAELLDAAATAGAGAALGAAVVDAVPSTVDTFKEPSC